MKQKRMMIVLYGDMNQGKTSTLMQLAINLAGGGTAVANSIHNTFIRKGKYKDGHLIVEYRERLIYIATGGDSWVVCWDNTEFFENNFHNLAIYKVNAAGVKKLSAKDQKTYKEHPSTVVISACRPNEIKNGAIKALHYYSENAISDYVEQLWLRMDDDIDKMANEIQKRIDEFI